MSKSSKQIQNAKKSTPRLKIPINVLIILMICGTIFITSGGIYDLINKPGTMETSYYTGTKTTISLTGEQTLTESIFSLIMTGLIFVGLWLVNRAAQVTYDRGKANTSLGLGMVCIVLGLGFLYYIINIRNGG